MAARSGDCARRPASTASRSRARRFATSSAGADRCPAFLVRVEQPSRPVRRRSRAGDEVGDRSRLVGHDRLLLGGERGRRRLVRAAVDAHAEAAFGDPRQHLDLHLERPQAELLEPEAVLLDEVERQPVAPRRARRQQRDGELDLLARGDRPGQTGAQTVPVEPGSRAGRASGTRAARRRPGRSARWRCPRSRRGRGRGRAPRHGASPARTRATAPRAVRRGRDARRRAPSRG